MQDVNLNRFIDRMAQLITKYADAVDWNELPDPDYKKLNIDESKAASQEDYEVMGSCDGKAHKVKAETSVSAISFYLEKILLKTLYRRKIESYTIYRSLDKTTVQTKGRRKQWKIW